MDEQQQEKDRALRDGFRALPDAMQATIRAKMLVEHPEARKLPADSPIVEALCLAEFKRTYLAGVTSPNPMDG